jgi:RNA polymerase sigma-70 factor (ECF subfamily)
MKLVMEEVSHEFVEGQEVVQQVMSLTDKLASNLDEPFEQLVLDYQDRLYAFALRLATNPQDAEEITQDAFVRAYRALATYTRQQIQELALRPWLYQITLNVFKNRVRRKQHPGISLDHALGGEVIEPAEAEHESPQAIAEQQENRILLQTHLQALPQRFRIAVTLKHIEGLGYPELAEILQVPLGTAKSHVHRGIALLRNSLIQEEIIA